MFFLGDTVLLPAIYFSLEGIINPVLVIVLSLVATLISDLIWYEIAARVPFHKIQHWKRIENHTDVFNHLMEAFDRYHLWILFWSKFVYGTRILVQIICGAKKVHFGKYIVVNAIGSTAYILLLYGIAIAVQQVVGVRMAGEFKIVLLLFVVIVVIIHLCIKHLVQKKLLQ
jgi:membrane protein DedA with SNARE-associated domain